MNKSLHHRRSIRVMTIGLYSLWLFRQWQKNVGKQQTKEKKKHGREVWGAYRKCRLPNTFGWNAAVYTASASRHEFSVRSDSLGHVISRRHGTFQKRDATWLFLFFFFFGRRHPANWAPRQRECVGREKESDRTNDFEPTGKRSCKNIQ